MIKKAVKTGRKLFLPFSLSFSRQRREKARRATAVLLCTLLILSLSSCWSRRELNTLAIVLGTGLDVGDQPDTLKLTAQVVKASAIGSGSTAKAGGAGEKAYVNISYTDKSVLSVLRGITHMQSRRPYFSHNEVFIFSSDLAKRDMAEGLDAFARDYESLLHADLLISKGKASDILQGEAALEKIPARQIGDMMEDQEINSETAVVTLRDFSIATLSGSKAPVAPMIEVYESGGEKHIKLEDTAVFKGGKMIGELDKSQTRGLLWVTNQAKSGVKTLDTRWGQVVLEIFDSNSKLKPVKNGDGTIRMELTVNEDGTIESNETNEDMSRLENVEMLKGLMKEAIRADIENALHQARTLSADVFGFGEAIHQEYPEEWEKMKENWEREFPKIGLNVQVNVMLHSTGSLTEPVVPGGGQ